MALRVLLADESVNIKKSMLVSLQDYGVEVKTVPIGVDVLPVTIDYRPDIIFVDVLLQKMNGYEVSFQLKSAPETHSIPVVLMWSNFMELDEPKAKNSLCDMRMEKPFDKETLRDCVQKLVKKTQSQNLGDFLTFPSIQSTEASKSTPSLNTTPQINSAMPAPPSPQKKDLPPSTPSFNLPTPPLSTEPSPHNWLPLQEEADEFEEKRVTLNKSIPEISPLAPQSEDLDDWSKNNSSSTQSLNQNTTSNFPKINESITSEDNVEISLPQIHYEEGEEEFQTLGPNQSLQEMPQKDQTLKTPHMTQEEYEKIISFEVQKAVEGVIWKILPEITEKVIKSELQSLLKEMEKN